MLWAVALATAFMATTAVVVITCRVTNRICLQVYYRDDGACETTGFSRATRLMWFRNSIGCAILFSGSKPAPVPRTVTVP